MPRRALENWQFNKLKHILSFTSRSDSSFTFNNLIYITSSQNTHVTIKLSFPIIYFSVRAFFFIQEQQKKFLSLDKKKSCISRTRKCICYRLFSCPPLVYTSVIITSCMDFNLSLKLVSAIFIKFLFFHQMIALQKLWKMLFISLKKLFSFSRYSNFRISVLPFFFYLSAIALEDDQR